MFVESHKFPFIFPDKTVALTYDDGPGPHTVELAEFLKDQAAPSTFFAVGKYIQKMPDEVRQVHELGHLIANHTMTHPYLPDLLRLGRQTEIISEVVDNHRLIEAVVGHGPAFFRAPFGGWEPGLAKLLNRPAYLREYMGPVNWDIERCDYGLDKIIDKQPYDSGDLRAAAIGSTYTFEMCKDNYWLKFRAERKGIVLLHDWAADEGPDGDFLREHNRIFELTEWLVPKLKDDGFTFVRLDDQRLGAC